MVVNNSAACRYDENVVNDRTEKCTCDPEVAVVGRTIDGDDVIDRQKSPQPSIAEAREAVGRQGRRRLDGDRPGGDGVGGRGGVRGGGSFGAAEVTAQFCPDCVQCQLEGHVEPDLIPRRQPPPPPPRRVGTLGATWNGVGHSAAGRPNVGGKDVRGEATASRGVSGRPNDGDIGDERVYGPTTQLDRPAGLSGPDRTALSDDNPGGRSGLDGPDLLGPGQGFDESADDVKPWRDICRSAGLQSGNGLLGSATIGPPRRGADGRPVAAARESRIVPGGSLYMNLGKGRQRPSVESVGSGVNAVFSRSAPDLSV